MAEFTVTFNVETKRTTSDWASYRQFIDSLRSRLGDSTSHNLPVLPPQQNPPSRWFDVVLEINSAVITLRIRRDNLHLEGYRVNAQWFEFASASRLIPGSTFLDFDGSYTQLEHVAGRGRESIGLGQDQLVGAVNLLSTSTIGRERAESLIIVIQMISESLRFQRITEHLASINREAATPPTWMTRMENAWGDLSERLLREQADPDHPFRLPQEAGNAMEIRSADDAVRALGILLFFSSNSHRFPRMAETQLQSFLQGRPMAEVFNVRINNIDGESPGDLYGTVTVCDGLLCQYIYNRVRDDSESVYPGGSASLTGPDTAISASGSFTIYIALMDRDRDLSPDDEVSNGTITWNAYNPNYEKLINVEVGGRYGSAAIFYAVFHDAVEANIKVTLINGDDENPADVYGTIVASNTNIRDGESVLYSKKQKEYIDVSPGSLIPLSRSVVAVPTNSSLKVRAVLYDYDTLSSDDEIANGTAEFQPQKFGISTQNIKGEYGEIQVKVIWNI